MDFGQQLTCSKKKSQFSMVRTIRIFLKKIRYRSSALKSRSKLRAAFEKLLLHQNSSLCTVTFGEKVLTLAKSRSARLWYIFGHNALRKLLYLQRDTTPRPQKVPESNFKSQLSMAKPTESFLKIIFV